MLKRLTLPAVLSISFLLIGCATNTAVIADSSCKSFKPISGSKQDTEPTRRQVVAHNRVYDTVCSGKSNG